MTILTENNAFQNISKCLQKRCSDYSQIEDFLQYCIELIFYDKTCIAGIVPPNVTRDSRNIAEFLESAYSIDNIAFENVEDNSDKADKLIGKVTKALYAGLDSFFDKFKRLTANEALNFLPRLSKDSMELVASATKAINRKDLKIVSDEYVKMSAFAWDSCYFKIIHGDERIIDKIFEFDDTVGWNETMTLNLLTEIRFLTNRSLSNMNNQIFLPSIKRGRIDNLHRLAPQRIESIIKEAGALIGCLEMPSVIDYLTERGSGNPADMIKIARELRETFTPVRNYIHDMGKDSPTNTIASLNEIANKLFEKIRKGMPYNSKMIFENVHTQTVGAGFFTVSGPVSDSQTIERLKKIDVCVEAFTEVVDSMIKEHNYGYNTMLINNCMK
jgi:hypothetical protein